MALTNSSLRGPASTAAPVAMPKGARVKIRLKVDISGTRDGKDWPRRGETMELPDDEAAALCAADMAEPVAEKAADKAETRTSSRSSKSEG